MRRATAVGMTDIGHGSVIRYAYLWAREHDRGEEAGRKVRPACIVLITRGKDGREIPLIFPITSRSPRPGTEAVEIPEIEGAVRGSTRQHGSLSTSSIRTISKVRSPLRTVSRSAPSLVPSWGVSPPQLPARSAQVIRGLYPAHRTKLGRPPIGK